MKKKIPYKNKKNKKARRSRSNLRDVFGIILVTLAILVTASVLSFDPADPPNGSASPVRNSLGIAGAHIAYYLIHFTFGRILSLAIPLLMILNAFELIRRKGYRLSFRWGSTLLLAVVLASTSWDVIREILGLERALEYTGAVGYGLSNLMYGWLGRTGSVIVLAGMALIFLTVVLGIRWAGVVSAVQVFVIWIGRLLGLIRLLFIPKRTPIQKIPRREDTIEDESVEEEYEAVRSAQAHKRDDIRIVKDGTEPAGAQALTAKQKDGSVVPEDTDATYVLPPIDLLEMPASNNDEEQLDEKALRKMAAMLEDRLAEFGVKADVIQIHPGPVVTRFDLKPAPGVKVGRIVSLGDDLALGLEAPAVRIQAPIPGAGAVGIEIPNKRSQTVYIREIVESAVFQDSDKPLMVALGRTAQGDVFVTDLVKLPHILIAGTTGSGKSVCINTIIASILMRNKPDEVMIAMIDPKKLELSAYAELRKHHLLYLEDTDEVIATEPKNAVALLQSVVGAMESRYTRLAETGVRNIREFNDFVDEGKIKPDEDGNEAVRLPYIIMIIDELADLMLTAAREVEEPIARLAQMGRAVGIHLVVATQRPSVDVITGVIKANFPARLAFMVASKIDSRTILDRSGAETLLGRGDCLFLTGTTPHPARVHCALISTEEVHRLITHVARQPAYIKRAQLELPENGRGGRGGTGITPLEGRDELFPEAVKLVVRHQQGSVSLLQRRLKIGYSRAGRLLDQLEQAGIVGPFEGSKAREVRVQPEDVEDFLH